MFTALYVLNLYRLVFILNRLRQKKNLYLNREYISALTILQHRKYPELDGSSPNRYNIKKPFSNILPSTFISSKLFVRFVFFNVLINLFAKFPMVAVQNVITCAHNDCQCCDKLLLIGTVGGTARSRTGYTTSASHIIYEMNKHIFCSCGDVVRTSREETERDDE